MIDRPLRIALFSGNYNFLKDGAALTLNRLVGYLEDAGHKVLVFSPTLDKPAFEGRGTVVSVPSISVPRRPEYRLGLGLPGAIRRRLAAFAPDIVHLSAPDLLCHSAQRWALKHRVMVIASQHTRFETYARYYGGAWAERYLIERLRQFYSRCAAVLVPNAFLGRMLRDQGMNEDVRIWSRGVDTDAFSPAHRDEAWRARIPGSGPIIAYVGRLVLEKAIEVVAKTSAQLTQQGHGHRLLIVGDGPERGKMAGWVRDAHFTGFIHGADLARAYASADIFFYPSLTETFGNVTLEAMASGLAAVCADATGANALVVPGKTGYLATPDSIDDFAEKISTLIGDDALRRRMGEAARVRAQDFDADAVMQSVLDNYCDLLDAAGDYPTTRIEAA